MNSFIKKLLKRKGVESNESAPQTSRGRPGSREVFRTTGYQPSSGFQDPANKRASQLLPLLVKPPVPTSAEVRKRPQPVVLPEVVQRWPPKSGPRASRTDQKYPQQVSGEAAKEQIVLPKLPAAKPSTSTTPVLKKKPSEWGAPLLPELSDDNFRYLWGSKNLQKGKTVQEAVDMMDEKEILDTILAHLQHSLQTPSTDPKQAARGQTTADSYAASQKTAAPSWGWQAPSQDKIALYKYYGMKLRDSSSKDLVWEHLHMLLRLTGQDEDREGISEAVGLVASRHLPEILGALRNYGQLVITRKTLQQVVPEEQRNVFERQLRATLILCYGQAAFGAKPEEIFPRAELFVSEVLFYFQGIYKDEAIKRCFLKSVVLITKALQHCRKEDIPRKTELVICIIEVIDEEPMGSYTITILHQAIITISSLTTLKPPLDSHIRSDLVSKSIEKVFSLPSLKMMKLKAGSPMHPTQTQDFYQQTVNACNNMLIGLLSEAPRIESLQDILIHTNGWIESQKIYERERAVRSTNYILKFVSEHFNFNTTQEFSLLGHLLVLLSLRIADSAEDIGMQAAEAIYYLHYIIMGKLASEMEKKSKNKKGNVVKWFREDFFVSGPSVFFNNIAKVAKAFGEHLTPSQISELVLRAIDNLTHEEKAISRGAGVLLSSFLQECGADMEDSARGAETRDTVMSHEAFLVGQHYLKTQQDLKLPMVIKEIYMHLPDITDSVTKEETLKAVRNLASKRLNGIVDILLEISLECDNSVAEMWMALAYDPYSNIRIIGPLLKRLQDEEPLSEVSNTRRHSKSLMPIAATNALCLILSLPESEDAVQGKFAHLLIALVTQIYFVIGTGRRGSRRLSDAESPATPLSSAIQALKNLIACAGYIKEYNLLGTQGCWDMLATPDKFFEGIFLLIRCLFASNKMHLKQTFKQANTYLRRPDVKERTIGMAFFAELLVHMQIGMMFVKQDILDVLHEWMVQACPLMQVFSIRGLGYLLKHSFEDEALERFVNPLLTCSLDTDKNIAKESIKTFRNLFWHLGTEDFAPVGMTLIPHLLQYFNDEDNELRGSAIGLFGMLLKGVKNSSKQSLKEEVSKAFVPLLIQLMDPWTREFSKDAFATCISYMNWGDVPKDVINIDPSANLFYTYGNICKYFMRKNKQKLPEMVAQMLEYLKSRFSSHREAAAILIGCSAQYMKSDLSTKEIEDIYIALQELQADHEPTVAKIAFEATEEFLRHCGNRVNPAITPSTSVRRSSTASETRK